MIHKYSIAKFNILINSDDKYLETMLLPYTDEFEVCADIEINVSRTQNVIEASCSDFAKLSDGRYYCRIDGKDSIVYHDSNIGKIISLTVFEADYSRVNITAYDITQDYDITDKNFVFNLVGNAMRYCVMMKSGFVFHSSAIAALKGGVVFSAPSGTGKSTHTALWQKAFDDVTIVNDDTPIIRVMDDGVWLCGTPWAGTTGINANLCVPLRGIVFLSQSPTNTITKTSVPEFIKLFTDGTNVPLTVEMHLKALDTLNEIALKVPSYKLHCNMDIQAALLAECTIFNK